MEEEWLITKYSYMVLIIKCQYTPGGGGIRSTVATAKSVLLVLAPGPRPRTITLKSNSSLSGSIISTSGDI